MGSTKTVLVVGAGYGQLPAIRKAQALGWRAVTVDRDPSAPGMAIADRAYTVDIVDLGGVLAVARAERVDGVVTLQSDLPVPAIGHVNSALGLTGVDVETARVCSRKDLARARWAAAGVPQPAFVVVRSLDEAKAALPQIGVPCVVKATDSSGSRGVVRVDHADELPAAWTAALAYARSGTVLVEAFVAGREIGAQTFSVDGRCALVLFHNDETSRPPYMVPIAHSYPLVGVDTADGRLEAEIARAVDALGLRDGPANIDLILDDDGDAMLIEIGARVGATCLPELTTLFTGVDWVEATLRSATGETPDLALRAAQPCAAAILEAPADGVVQRITVPDWLIEHPDVVEFEVTVKPGDAVQRLRKGTDRIGHVLAKGATVADAEALMARARDAIDVAVA